MADRPLLWVLDGREGVPLVGPLLGEIERWAEFMESDRRVVAQTEVEWADPNYPGITDGGTVSTVFLGIDASHGLGPVPVLFETAFIGGPEGVEVLGRWATWDEAVAGHRDWAERLTAGLP